jgi:hypothetical protein
VRFRILPIASIALLSILAASTTAAAATGAPSAARANIAPVNLGSAAAFAILSKSGVTDVPASVVKGTSGPAPSRVRRSV